MALSSDKKTRMKQIRTLVILAVMVIIFGVAAFSACSHTDPRDYSEMDFEQYITFEDYTKGKIKSSSESETVRQVEIWQQVLATSEVKAYPEKNVEAYYEDNLQQYEKLAVDYGYETFDAYVKGEHATDVESFKEQLKEYAKSQVKNDMLVYAIAEKEGLSITEEEYDAFLEKTLNDTGLDHSEFEEIYGMTIEEYGEANFLKTTLLQDKVMKKIAEVIEE